MKTILKAFSIILISLLLCSCGSTKLYTEEEVLGYQDNRFSAEFVVLEKTKSQGMRCNIRSLLRMMNPSPSQ